jgi:hypothetical protein
MEIKLTEDFNVICAVCEKPVEAAFWNNEIIIDPCLTCLQAEREEGKKEAE